MRSSRPASAPTCFPTRGSVSDLILTDVFHHLKYPGTALKEFSRVLRKGGRVILLEPCISALGLLVYGVLHEEPIAINKEIEWKAPKGWSPEEIDYHAAQGNASRVFVGHRFRMQLAGWQKIRPSGSPRLPTQRQVAFPSRSCIQHQPCLWFENWKDC
jgi:hypothetical protein